MSEDAPRPPLPDDTAPAASVPGDGVPDDNAPPFALRVRAKLASTPGLDPGDEDRLRAQGRWEDLIEVLLLKMEATPPATGRARIFADIAHVFHDGLSDGAQALDAALEAWDLDPTCDDGLALLEQLATEEGRWPEVFAATEALVAAEKNPARALALHDRMVWWLTLFVPTPDLAAHYAERIRVLDSTHAAVHLHQATVYRGHGDLRRELEELDRAALSAKRREDRARLHVLMAQRQAEGERLANPAESRRQLVLALAQDAACKPALLALEAIYTREADMPALAGVLEKHVEAATTVAERIATLTRLAEIYEHHFLKPDQAAEQLETAFSLDPHDMATLASLERCYQATRAWPSLARALEVAALSEEEPMCSSCLRKLADVQDTRLEDAAGAIKTYERLHRLWREDQAVLSELARLSEKAGDWRSAARWRGVLAGLLPTAPARARMHLAAGQLLAPADREPLVARAHLEEAVEHDPSLEAAWSALVWDARQAADYARVAHYTALHAERAEGGRRKGELFVELALVRRSHQDDELGAIQAYELARAADPSNESAARALLDLYVASERWEDADQLCEVVAVAAERDGDIDLLASTLRLGRRIALAFQDHARALKIAVSCFDLRGDEPEVRAELIESAFDMRETPGGLLAAKSALLALAERADDLSPHARARLGETLSALGAPEAAGLFESVLVQEPMHPLALAGLARILEERGDLAPSSAYKHRHAATLEDSHAKLSRLVDVAESYGKAGDVAKSAAAYEEARALSPADHQILHSLLGAYQKLERWAKVAEVLGAIAQADSDPKRRARTLFTMAQIARDKQKDVRAAKHLFDEALDNDPSRLEAFERIVRLCTDARDWTGLAESYRRMLARVIGSGETTLQHALYHQLGLVYRDRLRDHERAVESFRAATELRPDSEEDQTILRELLSLGGRGQDALALGLEQARRDPLKPSQYPPLFALAMGEVALDRALSVASVMNHLGALGEQENAFFRAHASTGLPSMSGRLDEALRLSLLHPELDPALTRVFAIVAPAVVELKLAQVSWKDRLAYPGPAMPTEGPVAWIAPTVARVSEALGLAPARLHQRPGPGPALTVAATRPPSLIASVEAIQALPSPLQAFVFGKRAFELAPELLLRGLCPTVSELAGVLGAAHRAAGLGGDARTASDDALRGKLKKHELDFIAADLGGRELKVEEVERWAQLADLSTSRAGMLIAGDLELARGALAREPMSPGDLPAREQMKELVTFALSEEYLRMRRALGIAVGGR